MYKYKKDKYQKTRGGNSRILNITCEHCGEHITYYQKDGPGILKRMYFDRFIDYKPTQKELICKSCNRVVGIKFNYKKENRSAYRMFVGSTAKKIISQNKISELR